MESTLRRKMFPGGNAVETLHIVDLTSRPPGIHIHEERLKKRWDVRVL